VHKQVGRKKWQGELDSLPVLPVPDSFIGGRNDSTPADRDASEPTFRVAEPCKLRTNCVGPRRP